MSLKGNQPILMDLTESIFNRTVPMSTYITEEKSHGRLEKRTCSIFDTALLEQEGMYEQWTGMDETGVTETHRGMFAIGG